MTKTLTPHLIKLWRYYYQSQSCTSAALGKSKYKVVENLSVLLTKDSTDLKMRSAIREKVSAGKRSE